MPSGGPETRATSDRQGWPPAPGEWGVSPRHGRREPPENDDGWRCVDWLQSHGVNTDHEMRDYIRGSVVTLYHPGGTCAMGGDVAKSASGSNATA